MGQIQKNASFSRDRRIFDNAGFLSRKRAERNEILERAYGSSGVVDFMAGVLVFRAVVLEQAGAVEEVIKFLDQTWFGPFLFHCWVDKSVIHNSCRKFVDNN